MGLDEEMQVSMKDLLKRTGNFTAWKRVKNNPVERHKIEHLAMEKDVQDNEIYNKLYKQGGGCLLCKRKDVKPKDAYPLKSGGLICRKCYYRGIEIKKAHPDFICGGCGAYLPLPENIKIWTKERDGTLVCLSCSHKKKTNLIRAIDMEGKIFIPVIRWKLNGHNLFVARTRAESNLGIKSIIKRIAEYCGCIPRRYYKYEEANQGGEQEILTINTETKMKLDNAFVELTGKTPEEWYKD